MSDSLFLNNPILSIGFLLSYLLSLIALLTKMKSPVLPLLSLVLALALSVYSLLLGAALKDLALLISPLFILMLISYLRDYKTIHEL